MTLEERLKELYPVVKQFTKQDFADMRKVGMSERIISFLKSGAMMNSMINDQLREAYLLGRAEKDLYNDEQ